jgi:signal transduction histidine kinase
VLFAVIGGLLLVGVMLAYAAVRVVNELRRLYAEQQAAAQMLAEASRAKTDFLADASHELRTPLTVLRGNAEVGLALDGTGDQKEILEDIVKESGKMTRMVEDLLFLARSDSASLPLEMEPVPVVPFLTELGVRAAALARERGAKLETDLSGAGVLEMDQGRVEQAVLILVDNAAKYGPPGGKVSLSSETRSGELRVTVADEGPGIPEEELTRVFERFYRMDKTRSRRLGGSGLGLPIANTIVETHGGRIEAESRVGIGTSMSIHLPLIPADEDRQEGVSPRSSTRQEA